MSFLKRMILNNFNLKLENQVKLSVFRQMMKFVKTMVAFIVVHTFFFIRNSNFIRGLSVLSFLRSQHDENKISPKLRLDVLINCVLIKKKVCIHRFLDAAMGLSQPL